MQLPNVVELKRGSAHGASSCRCSSRPRPTPTRSEAAVELRQLRYFVAVAEDLHFRRAAERLHVAQPAVSEQVRKLEVDLGVQLFERTHRSVSLTDAGVALLEEARRVLRQTEVARQAARGASERAAMRLRIGYLPDLLPAAVPARAAPARRVTSRRAGRSRERVGVAAHRRCAARTAGRGDHEPSGADERVRVAAARRAGRGGRASGHAPARRRAARSPSGGSHRSGSSCFPTKRTPRSATPWSRCVTPRVSHRHSSMSPSRGSSIALLAVVAGIGPAILPESVTARYATPGVRFVPLADARASFRIVALTQPDHGSLATAAFLRALERTTHAARRRAVTRRRRPVRLTPSGPDDLVDTDPTARARRVEPDPATST